MEYKIEIEELPVQTYIPNPIQFSQVEQVLIDTETNRFLECGIIERVSEPCENEFHFLYLFFAQRRMVECELF